MAETVAVAVSGAVAEVGGAERGEARLNRRLGRVAARLGAPPGASLPVACGGWVEAQAVARGVAHEAVPGEPGLAPHGDGSVERMRRQPVVLGVQDRTEVDDPAQSGIAGLGPVRERRQPGWSGHPPRAVTPAGVALGVLDAWRWTRDREPGGDDTRHGPLAATARRRGVEGVARGAARAASRPDPRWVSVAERAGDRHAFRGRAHREPGRLADPGQPQPLPGRGRPAVGSAGAGPGVG